MIRHFGEIQSEAATIPAKNWLGRIIGCRSYADGSPGHVGSDMMKKVCYQVKYPLTQAIVVGGVALIVYFVVKK